LVLFFVLFCFQCIDVQDLVADFQLEQRRTRETSSSNNADDCCDDDDDDNEQHHHHHDDHHHHQNGSIRNTRSSTAAAPVSDGIVREAVHSSRANAPKTGPKGVKADHEEYVRREYARWQAQQATAEAAAARNTATVRTVREDAVIDSLEQQLRDGVAVEQLLDAEDDDDDFMRTYRAARVAELKANAAAALARRVTFGELIDLDEDAYNAILEESGANVASVVHIFDDQLVACRRLNAKLRYVCNTCGYECLIILFFSPQIACCET
jgi:rubrerythrin